MRVTRSRSKSSAACDILVAGSVNSDFSIRASRLPGPGETLMGEEFLAGPGGKGANQAVAAARLGARVALAARVGRDERGDALRRGLREEGVDTRCVWRDAKASTGAAIIAVDDSGEKQILCAPGANFRLTRKDVAAAFRACAPQVVLMQLEVPLPIVRAAAEMGRKLGCKVVLDPAPPSQAVDDALLRLLDVIRPNSSEAEALTGVRVTNRPSARRAAQALLARGVKAAAVQAGSEGNLLVWEGGEEWLPRLPVKSVDATGAGDAFAAGLSVALAEGRGWAEAGWFGSAAAALATTRMGAQAGLPTRAALMGLLRRAAPPALRSRLK